MYEVKIFENGNLVEQMEGQAVFAVAASVQDDCVMIEGMTRGKMTESLFLDAMAEACTSQIVGLSVSVDDACEMLADFLVNVRDYAAEKIEKQYKICEEEKRDGQS